MDTYEYKEMLKSLSVKRDNIAKIIKPSVLGQEIEKLELKQQTANFWNDAVNAAKTTKQLTKNQNILKTFNNIDNALHEAEEYYHLAKDQEDIEILEILYKDSFLLQENIQSLEVQMLLDEEHDNSNAIISIHSGAGGTEAEDWTSMLYRMYLRWAERQGFKVELLDSQPTKEGGIKDVSFVIRGENVYGYLKMENGIHRLKRVSPHGSNLKRHTSFSSVMVSPEINEDIDIRIEDKDIREDTYRASGKGGQHVNKRESAVRITHMETGIVVQCQNDRSQHNNRATALKMLKSRLYDYERRKKTLEKEKKEKSNMGWGNQIRTYTVQPQQQVKDSRSKESFSDVYKILDGDITKLLEGVLISQKK